MGKAVAGVCSFPCTCIGTALVHYRHLLICAVQVYTADRAAGTWAVWPLGARCEARDDGAGCAGSTGAPKGVRCQHRCAWSYAVNHPFLPHTHGQSLARPMGRTRHGPRPDEKPAEADSAQVDSAAFNTLGPSEPKWAKAQEAWCTGWRKREA